MWPHVHFLAIEAGLYDDSLHGVKLEAVRFESTLTDNDLGEPRVLANTYLEPVVLGQVMTSNDPAPSTFFAHGSTDTVAPSPDALHVGKRASEDPNDTRVPETLGYIVIESGTGSLLGMPYDARTGAETIAGMDNPPPSSYPVSGVASASVALVSMATVKGSDGGWPVLYGPPDPTGATLDLVIDEDMLLNVERRHTTERVGFIVFE